MISSTVAFFPSIWYTEQEKNGREGDGMRVLVVEDEVRLSETIAQLLREQRYSVDVVHDGTDGLEYAMSGQYDVVVLDVMLPGMDGFHVVHALRDAKTPPPCCC